METQYGRHQFLKENKALRLATLIVDFNSAFSESLEQRGHAVDSCKTTFPPSKSPRKIKPMRSRKLKLKGCPPKWSGEEKLADGQDGRSTKIEHLEYPELMNILPAVSTPSPSLPESILEWIEREYKSSRGFELGTFNPSILPTLFQELSMKWEDLPCRGIRHQCHSNGSPFLQHPPDTTLPGRTSHDCTLVLVDR